MGQPSSEIKSTIVSSEDARRNLADLLAGAGHRHERFVITLYNKEHVALIGMRDYARLLEIDGLEAAPGATQAVENSSENGGNVFGGHAA